MAVACSLIDGVNPEGDVAVERRMDQAKGLKPTGGQSQPVTKMV
jgi:hypothetical protein